MWSGWDGGPRLMASSTRWASVTVTKLVPLSSQVECCHPAAQVHPPGGQRRGCDMARVWWRRGWPAACGTGGKSGPPGHHWANQRHRHLSQKLHVDRHLQKGNPENINTVNSYGDITLGGGCVRTRPCSSRPGSTHSHRDRPSTAEGIFRLV